MSITFLKDYKEFLTGTTATLPDVTEAALIAQGLATALGTTSEPMKIPGLVQFASQGGNVSLVNAGGETTATYYQGPLRLPCISLGSAALTGYETNGTAPVAGTMYLTEIHVPYKQTWTGIGKLNGTVVGTDNHLVALYGSNGALLANSAVAGVLAADASLMQNIAFTAPITLLPGRYFLGVQSNGTTATLRHLVTVNGANASTGAQAGTFGTVPATLTTVPITFTNAQGVIAQLYV